jgi:hypothetical protein
MNYFINSCANGFSLAFNPLTGEKKISAINLEQLGQWLQRGNSLSAEQTSQIQDFFITKMTNGTLFTPKDQPELKNPLYRLQLFTNSNIAEHAVEEILNGTLLETNDVLTLDSTANCNRDGTAKADVLIDEINVEVKIILNSDNLSIAKMCAHKSQILAVYTIRSNSSPHWAFYINCSKDKNVYESLAVLSARKNLKDSSKAFIYKVYHWQECMNRERPILNLIQIK